MGNLIAGKTHITMTMTDLTDTVRVTCYVPVHAHICYISACDGVIYVFIPYFELKESIF